MEIMFIMLHTDEWKKKTKKYIDGAKKELKKQANYMLSGMLLHLKWKRKLKFTFLFLNHVHDNRDFVKDSLSYIENFLSL